MPINELRSAFATVLIPVVDEFCQRYPDIQPDVQLDDGIGNWVLDRVDVGFRIGASPEEGVIARRLFPLQMLICGAPGYAARFGAPNTLDDLALHRCSVFRHPATGQVVPWYLNLDGAVVRRHVTPTLSTNDTELELQAVLAGQVIGQLANVSAAAHIRSGHLVPLLLPHMTDNVALHAHYGNRTAQPRRVRAFIDLAIQRLLDQPAYVLSQKELVQAAPLEGKTKRRR